MLFNSLEFVIFLPIVFLLYWFVFRKRTIQNFFLLTASYVFYGWWDWRFLGLIAITSFCSYVSGLLLERFLNSKQKSRLICACNIIINIGILCVFKYFNFFAENIVGLFRMIGMNPDAITIKLILPVGISFYTFQALSYTIDVYRKKVLATSDIVEFFAFISFFPQLVAGPIERASNLLPQFQSERQFDYKKAVDGMRQMLWGFFKKIVIADNCAFVVNNYWSGHNELSGLTLLILGVLFTLQIYCDFSGYSDIAIGTARLFGINLMRNFNYPYFSLSIPDFWRRWHISLTTWFRDYVYIPLGGNRCSKGRNILNVFIVWGISGLWHGANWTFVCWGLYHGVLLTIYNLLGINTKKNGIISEGRFFPTIKEFLQICLTFFLAVIGWIIFRSNNLTEALSFITRMLSTMFIPSKIQCGNGLIYLTMGFAMLFIEWLQRDKQHALQLPNIYIFKFKAVRWSLYAGILVMMMMFTGQSQQFIYFQF